MTVVGRRAGWRLSYVEFLQPVNRLLCGKCPNLALFPRSSMVHPDGPLLRVELLWSCRPEKLPVTGKDDPKRSSSVQAPTKYELVINLKTAKRFFLPFLPHSSPAPTR